MSKNTNLSFLTDYITADITNGRIGINNASPAFAFDVSGATRISGALTLTSTISNGTYTYTLPSATGTLALTSALSSYLPLTGGTLTGALGGTSASFSSTLTSVGSTINGANNAIIDLYNTALADANARNWRIVTNDSAWGSIEFKVSTANNNAPSSAKLTLASTGAATFTGSVQIGSTLNQTLSVGLSAPTTDTLNQIFVGQGAFGAQASGGETDIGNNWYYYSGFKYRITAPSSNIKLNGDVISFERAASGTANAAISFSESMRIASSGALLINSTAVQGGEALEVLGKISGSAQYGILCLGNPATYTNYALRFVYYANAVVGSITFSTTTTSYNTSSDYRLKEDLRQIKGLEKVSAIKVYDFKWKGEESRMDGVLAHELSEVLPYAVIGEKNGKDMQAVDYSKIVPVLVKAIQELSAENTSLINRIEALENK
jgi:hypothetical protein